jgi:predicted aspartyl protease
MAQKQPTAQSRTRALAAWCFFAAAPVGAAEIDFREAWGYGIVVDVHVQGVGPLAFLLDTGSESTVVRPEVAIRLGLRPFARIELVTVAGRRHVPQARLASLGLAGVPLGPLDVLIHALPAVRAGGQPIDGLLGRDALRDVSFTIDYVRRRLVLGRDLAGDGLPYQEIDGRPVVEARLRCHGDPVRMTVDSGVGGVVLFERSRPLPIRTTERVTALTNTGATSLRGGRLEALCLGRARLLDVPVAVQAEAAADRREDGLLPTRLFARVHFDAQRRTVRLEPW